MRRIGLFLTTLNLLGSGAWAEVEQIDKSKYSFFRPVPSKYLRDMTTDRPDKTESPFTIDPGHYQLEFDAATWTYDRNKRDNTRTRSYTVFAPNFRTGLTDKLEFDIAMTSFTSARTQDTQTRKWSRQQGFDDTQLRFKYNFWGNEGKDSSAIAIMVFAKIPTNQDKLGNSSYDGGVIVPLKLNFTDKLALTLMTEIDYQRGENVRRHIANFVNAGSLGYEFSDKISGFIELYAERSWERKSRWKVTLDMGGCYSLTDNIQLDGGVYIGLSEKADNVTPFLGMSWRF
ncbi:transporter [Candidatus Odyssella thessalonicensis]|uniref:transporter n=1 Tax=Candidatus Odyssella thessalonicensis TaxID=84647 RepID=UPI000225AF24|nr:transporter [Candidatus Odyssella thessalonicensis]